MNCFIWQSFSQGGPVSDTVRPHGPHNTLHLTARPHGPLNTVYLPNLTFDLGGHGYWRFWILAGTALVVLKFGFCGCRPSNLRIEGTVRDTAKEHRMNSLDICSIYQLNRILFCRISSRFEVREVWNTWEGAILLSLIVPLLKTEICWRNRT